MDEWAKLARTRELPENQLKIEFFRGPGPGGQKRNKTSSAVRITHAPSGLSATATEARSQAENRARAMDRLCHAITLHYRLAPVAWEGPIQWRMNPSNDRYLAMVGWVLDHLQAHDWAVGDTARSIGTTTGKLIDFLQRDSALWTHVNRKRAEAGLGTLKTG
jgi:hypothetical protein